MSALNQLYALLINFVYGVLVSFSTVISYKIIKNEAKLARFLFLSILALDLVLIYLYVMYNIFNGYFHIYYLLAFSLGFIFFNYVKKIVNKREDD